MLCHSEHTCCKLTKKQKTINVDKTWIEELIASVDDEENTFGTEWLLKLTAATGALIQSHVSYLFKILIRLGTILF